MELVKTSEKIIVWMHRNNLNGQDIANKIGITRQAWSAKIRDNNFSEADKAVLKNMGFKY